MQKDVGRLCVLRGFFRLHTYIIMQRQVKKNKRDTALCINIKQIIIPFENRSYIKEKRNEGL